MNNAKYTFRTRTRTRTEVLATADTIGAANMIAGGLIAQGKNGVEVYLESGGHMPLSAFRLYALSRVQRGN